MIGQKNNIEKLNTMKQNNKIPKLIIISGKPLSGKTSLLKEFCTIINKEAIVHGIDNKVADIKEMIQEAYDSTFAHIYYIENFEQMSRAGQNAVLKVFEEPPANTYFIITTNNEDAMLKTILSRGQLFRMEGYSKEELKEYCNNEELCSRFNTPSEIDYWKHKDLKEFDTLCQEVYKLISKKTPVEVFNTIRDKIGYDYQGNQVYYLYFINMIHELICKNYAFDLMKFKSYSNCYSNFVEKNRFAGTVKQNLVDTYIINVNRILTK